MITRREEGFARLPRVNLPEVLLDTQSTIALAQPWGGGEVASADGLRCVVPIRTRHAAPHRKYYGAHRGMIYYNFSADQYMGFHGLVVLIPRIG